MAIATKINIQSKSPEFMEFIEKIDSIPSKTQHLTIDGKQMDVNDQDFKDQRTRLATVRLEFEWGHPIYPINEYLASDLVYSEIAAIQNQQEEIAAYHGGGNV